MRKGHEGKSYKSRGKKVDPGSCILMVIKNPLALSAGIKRSGIVKVVKVEDGDYIREKAEFKFNYENQVPGSTEPVIEFYENSKHRLVFRLRFDLYKNLSSAPFCPEFLGKAKNEIRKLISLPRDKDYLDFPLDLIPTKSLALELIFFPDRHFCGSNSKLEVYFSRSDCKFHTRFPTNGVICSCGLKFDDSDSYQLHLKSTTEEGDQVHPAVLCFICNSEVRDQGLCIKSHMEEFHSNLDIDRISNLLHFYQQRLVFLPIQYSCKSLACRHPKMNSKYASSAFSSIDDSKGYSELTSWDSLLSTVDILLSQQNFNTLLICGQNSGITALDFDPKNGLKKEEIDEFLSLFVHLPGFKNCGIVMSPNGGLHIYCSYNDKVKNSNGQLRFHHSFVCTHRKIEFGVDVKNEGGFLNMTGGAAKNRLSGTVKNYVEIRAFSKNCDSSLSVAMLDLLGFTPSHYFYSIYVPGQDLCVQGQAKKRAGDPVCSPKRKLVSLSTEQEKVIDFLIKRIPCFEDLECLGAELRFDRFFLKFRGKEEGVPRRCYVLDDTGRLKHDCSSGYGHKCQVWIGNGYLK